MNQEVIEFLHEKLHLHQNKDTACLAGAVSLCLELGSVPSDLYARLSEMGYGSIVSIRKSMSRIAPDIWERGAGIFHFPEIQYESPLATIHHILYALSGRKIW